MGLRFHIGQKGINNLGEYIDQIDIDEHHGLQKNSFLKIGKTGYLPGDSVQSLPYFDDIT